MESIEVVAYNHHHHHHQCFFCVCALFLVHSCARFFPPFLCIFVGNCMQFYWITFHLIWPIYPDFFFRIECEMEGKKNRQLCMHCTCSETLYGYKNLRGTQNAKIPRKKPKKKKQQRNMTKKKNTSAYYTRYHTTTVIHSRASDWSSFVAFAMDCAKPILPVSSSSSLVLDHA